jgi:hypothetical protein
MAILYFELDADGAPGLLGRTLREFGQQVRQVEAHKAAPRRALRRARSRRSCAGA